MNNKEFKDQIYKKYETYKDEKSDNFFNKNIYKKNSKKLTINYISYILAFTFLITGVVYATTYYTKNIWKEPEEYIYEEEKKIKEVEKEKTISSEEAKKLAVDILKSIEVEYENISNVYMNKEPTLNRIEWVIEVSPEIDLRINAENGKLISFSNNKLLNYGHNDKTNKNEAIIISQKIIKKIKDSEKYEFSNIIKIDGSQWQADYCIKYNEIFNPYQCIRITFDTKKEKLIMLNIFDYDFENNPYIIEKEMAIELTKKKDKSIEILEIEKDIKMMNSIIYSKDNPADSKKEYKTEQIVRNVWNVKVKNRSNDCIEYYYIDATTGEIIGGDMLK